jgi:hypothetical protein
MPCVELKTPTGPGLAFVRMSGGQVRPCRFCRLRLARKLCDFPINPRGKTCDAPMCDGCSAQVGHADYCPAHKDQTLPQQQLFPEPA